jgi:CheY-like chemotaxis protein
MVLPDGLELTRLTRDSPYNRMTPVVLLSDDPRPNAMAQGFDAGASFFLYKPLDKDRLLRLVRATQGAIQQDRRRTRRVPIRSKVRLHIAGQDAGQDIEAETVDVSMEGLLVKAQRTIPVGTSVDVCLQLSKEMKPVTTVGCVVRLAGANQMGVHLGRLAPAESQRLQEFLLSMATVDA